MSFLPHRVISRLALDPELAALSVLDEALKQAACALLAEHQDIGRGGEPEPPATAAAHAIIDSAWKLRELLRRYRATLARDRRKIGF